MYFDGALNIEVVGAGILFLTPSRDELCYVLWIHFLDSNNTAKYEAALHSLRITAELGVKCLMVYGDSALVINRSIRTGPVPAR